MAPEKDTPTTQNVPCTVGEKLQWKTRAKADGFNTVAPWIRDLLNMKTKPLTSKQPVFIPSEMVCAGVAALADRERPGQTPMDHHVIVNLAEDAPDITPGEKVTMHVTVNTEGEYAGMTTVLMTAVRHRDSHPPGGIPTRTLVTAPQYYLTEEGVKALTLETKWDAWAKWHLGAPVEKPGQR